MSKSLMIWLAVAAFAAVFPRRATSWFYFLCASVVALAFAVFLAIYVLAYGLWFIFEAPTFFWLVGANVLFISVVWFCAAVMIGRAVRHLLPPWGRPPACPQANVRVEDRKVDRIKELVAAKAAEKERQMDNE